MKTAHGWKFPESDSQMSREMTPDGHYQRRNLDAALSYVRRFRTALDGGAHVGCWARPLAARFERVYAFEPAADTYACLVENMRTFECANVETVHAAVGDWRGRASVGLEGNDKAIRAGNTGARAVQEGADCPMMPIDDLALDDLDFLKLDVEGYEAAALRGARDTLRRCKPVVIFEDKGFVSRYGGKRGDCERILSDLGAKFIQRTGADQIWGW